MSEWIDLVDENGEPTGEAVKRNEIHAKGLRHRTAHVWIYRHTKQGIEVLLQKRAEKKDSFPGCYDTSSAGHVPSGQQPSVSALRELAEELGITAEEKDLKPIGRTVIRYDTEFYGRPFKDNEVVFVYAYDGTSLETGKCQLQAEEVSEIRWFLLNDVVQLVENKDPAVCVPMEGLYVLLAYLSTRSK